MKVLLVRPPLAPETHNTKFFSYLEPLALEYLGAGIQTHHDVKLLDMFVENKLQETIETFKPDIIGCGAYTTNIFTVKKIFAEVKKIMPGILTVVGGHHATLIPSDFFDENIDVIAMGEGIFPFKRICDAREKRAGFKDIENIYYRENGTPVFTFKKDHPELDTLPFPARNLISAYRDNYSIFLPTGPTNVALIRSSTGCVFRCKFCAISKCLNQKFYTRGIDNVMEELESLPEEFIFWIDDEILTDPKRAIAIARAIGNAGIRKNHWFYSRTDTVAKNPECIEEWAKIGLNYIMMGLESNRESDLKKMRKGTTIPENEEAIRICHANNIQVKGNFIIQPDFTKKDFKNLARYARELDVDIPSFSVMTPFPGTDLYEEVKDNLSTGNFNLFDMAHTVFPTKLPLKDFYKHYSDIHLKATSLKRKINTFRHMDARGRRRIFSDASKFIKKVKYSYLDHN